MFVCHEPASSLISDARYQEMSHHKILPQKYRDTGILSYFLIDEKVGLLTVYLSFFAV